MTKQETIQVLQSIEDRAIDFPNMTECDWVAIAAAKRHLTEEPVSEDLDIAIGEYCSNPDNFITYIDVAFAYRSEQKDDIPLIIKAIKFGANWQKQQMMAKAIEGVITFNHDGRTLFGFIVPDSFCDDVIFKDMDKVKLIIIKED